MKLLMKFMSSVFFIREENGIISSDPAVGTESLKEKLLHKKRKNSGRKFMMLISIRKIIIRIITNVPIHCMRKPSMNTSMNISGGIQPEGINRKG